jgi:hypothetical protein
MIPGRAETGFGNHPGPWPMGFESSFLGSKVKGSYTRTSTTAETKNAWNSSASPCIHDVIPI